MAGGQRIDDHSFWAGKGAKGSVFPDGAKVKMDSSAEGAGKEDYYEDTTAAIKSAQQMGSGKAKSHGVKDNYRH
jgi:hypothetical protein